MNLSTILRTCIPELVAIGTFLAPAVAFAQTYNPIHAPRNESSHYFAYCEGIDSGTAIAWCQIGIQAQYYENTNAHWHNQQPHPSSDLVCVRPFLNGCSPTQGTTIYANTASIGSVEIYVLGSLVGQAEKIKTWPTSNPVLGARYKDYAIGYKDLFYADHPEIWIKIGGEDTGGGTNHSTTAYNRYMQLTNPPYYNTGPAYGLYYATQRYLGDHPEITHVCTNDMGLPYGGKFDICNELFPGCTGTAPWASPHAAHDRGTAGDVAGFGSAQCTNAGGSGVNIDEFINDCVANGALPANSINEGNHAHCQFSDPNTWPQ